MRKTLLILSFASLIILAVGTSLAPNNSMFWLANGDVAYQIVRMILSAMLLLQIFTEPPRQLYFRIMSGVAALAITVWALQLTYINHMLLLDSFSILAASIATGLTALELSPSPSVKTSVKT